MPTFIKTGFWDKKKSGYAQELNLDNLITSIAGNGNVGPIGPQGPQGPIGPTGATGSQGPTGLQGEQGVPGTAGAVGPAGLNWEGAWVSETSYMEDDAVAYDGASWFCILATSGTTAPDLDTTHWALLASQGAQGVQGIQGITGATGAAGATGPTGPQGIQGPGATQTLQQTVTLGNEIIDGIYKTTLTADGVLMQRTAQFGDYGSSIQINSTDIFLASAVTGTYGAITLPSAGLLSGDCTYTLPDASGTVALQSYKVWRAKINSSSVVTVYSDEIGFTSPVITNPFNGKILITKTGFFTGVNANKIDLITSTVNNSGTPFVCTLERYNIALSNSIVLNVFDMAGGQTGTPGCNFTVEIRIYN